MDRRFFKANKSELISYKPLNVQTSNIVLQFYQVVNLKIWRFNLNLILDNISSKINNSTIFFEKTSNLIRFYLQSFLKMFLLLIIPNIIMYIGPQCTVLYFLAIKRTVIGYVGKEDVFLIIKKKILNKRIDVHSETINMVH